MTIHTFTPLSYVFFLPCGHVGMVPGLGLYLISSHADLPIHRKNGGGRG